MKVPGFTPGNGVMRLQSKKIRTWLEEEFGIKAYSLPYQIEFGGAFLKDSAHLAGLGVIGKNNLLVTPEYGTRVRLRGMFIEAEVEPTGPLDFDPCNGCDRPCHRACPRDAFRSGVYERRRQLPRGWQARTHGQGMWKRDADTELRSSAAAGKRPDNSECRLISTQPCTPNWHRRQWLKTHLPINLRN